MSNTSAWTAAPLIALVACMCASRAYAQHQEYKTGVYIGKAAFRSADFQNRRCLAADASQPDCAVQDLTRDTVMENALASANIIPALADSTAVHTGFRDGWREARTAAFQ